MKKKHKSRADIVRSFIADSVKSLDKKIRAGKKVDCLDALVTAAWSEATGASSDKITLSTQDLVKCCSALVEDAEALSDIIRKFGTLNYDGCCTDKEIVDIMTKAVHLYIFLNFLNNRLAELKDIPEKAELESGLSKVAKMMEDISENLKYKRFMVEVARTAPFVEGARDLMKYDKPWWLTYNG